MEQQINLYQPVMGASRHLFSAAAIAAATTLMIVTLAVIAAFSAWHVRRADRTIAAVEAQDATRVASAERTLSALHAGNSVASMETTAKSLAADIADLEQVLAAVRSGSADTAGGFSTQLTTLGYKRTAGIWLTRIVLSTGDRSLALIGAATDPRLVGRYISTLVAEPAFGGASFSHFALRQPADDEPAVATMFEVGTPPSATVTAGKAP